MAKKIKCLSKYLTQTTGLDADERALWRNKINDLMDIARAEKNPAKQRSLKEEAFKVFNSFSYWKSTYHVTQTSK